MGTNEGAEATAGLTPLEVKNAKPGRHADGKGLYLLVKPSGAKSWVLRVQVGGRRRDYGLGSLDLVSLSEARDRALEYRKAAKSGLDPSLERKKAQRVLTLYSPKSHKLNFLRSQAEQIAPALIEAWPREGKFERRGFELLRQAYVNARYSPHYKISDRELAWLIERVVALQQLVQRACLERLRP